MAAKCKKFEANIFNKNKCGVCFKSKHEHSAAALECSKAARKISKCGYLFIAPDLTARRWQRRFFILYDDGELTYSVDENVGTVPQGVMDMNECEDVFDAEEQSGHEFSIAIVVPQKTYYVKGTSREEINRWHDVLVMYPRSIKTKVKRTLPPTPSSPSKKPVEISPSYSQPQPTPTHKPLTLSHSQPVTSSGPTRPLLSSARFGNSFDLPGVDASQSALASTLQPALAEIREPVLTREPLRDSIHSTSLQHESPPEPRSYDQYPSSNSSQDNDNLGGSLKHSKSDHGLNDVTAGAMHLTPPVSYRGVRSLKHKHDDRYHDGLRKSNSLHDLPTCSTSNSQDDLTDKFLSKDWYKASPNGLGSSSLSPQNTYTGVSKNKVVRARSFSSPSSSQYEPEKPRTLFHTLLDEQLNPKPQSSYYAKLAGVPKSKVDYTDRQRAHERRKTQPEIRYLDTNRTDMPSLKRRSSFQGDNSKNGMAREPSPPDTVFKYGRRGLESLASEYANANTMPQSPEKKSRPSPEKTSPKNSEPAPQVPEKRFDRDEESMDAEDGACLKKGWLHKQGASDKEWSKYWFVLHGDALKYFKDSRAEELNTLDGRIGLSYCYEVAEVDATKNYGFKVRTRNGSYILSAMTSGIRNNWVQALTKYVKKPGSVVSSPAQSDTQSPKTTRSGARLRRTLPHIGSKSVSENESPSDFNRRNTVDSVKLGKPEVTDPYKSPIEPTESAAARRRSDRLSERLSERRLRRSSIEHVSDRPSRRARTLRQAQVDETSSCGSQTSIPEVAASSATNSEAAPSPKSPKHDSSHYHRRRSDASRFRSRHHSSGSEYGSNDSLSLLKEPETRLLAKSPIEKKLDKLRSRSGSRVKSPPPPSTEERVVLDMSVRSASSTDERAVVELLETEVESLQNQLERAQKELLSVHKDNINLKTQIRLKKEKEKEEEDELDGDDDDDDVHLLEKCNMLEMRIGELELENTVQINEKASMDTKLDRMKKENDQLMNSIQGLKQDNSELKKQLRSAGSETGDLQKELESLKNDMLRLKDVQDDKNNELVETQQKLEEYRTDSRKKKRQVREKDDQISDLKDQVEKKSAESDRLSKRYENILAQLEEKTSSLELNRVDSKMMKERESQLAKVQAELERKNRECADMMNKYNAVSTEVQDLRAALEESSRRQNQHTDSLQTRDELVESLNSELSKLKRDCQTLERQSNDMSKELQDTKTTLRDSLQILDSQKSRVDEKDEQIHDLKKQLEKRNYDFEDMFIKCEDLTSELEHMKTTLEEHEDELDQEKAESDEKEAEIEDLKQVVAKKSGDCELLLKKYNELLAENDDLKAGVETGHELALLDQLEEKEEDIIKLREDLEDRTEDCEDLSDRIDDLEHQLVDAKAALVEAEHRANRQQNKERRTESVDVSTETDFDIPSSAVLPVKMDQIVQTFFVEQKQSRSLDSDYSSDINIIKSLRSKVKENEDKCDELDFMNIKLNEKVRALMEQYDGEIKSYGARIDDLVEKLRQEQIKKRRKQEMAVAMRGEAVGYSKDVERELLKVEQKIAQAETELIQQESTAEELENQIGSVELKLSSRKDEDEGMSSQEEGSCSTVSSPGVSDSEQDRDGTFEPISLFQDGQDYDNNNSNQFFSRIQGLHDKVAQSNAKLKEVLGMLDSSHEEEEEEDVTPASQEQTHDVRQRLAQCEQRLQSMTSRLQSNENSHQSSHASTPPLGHQTLRGVISTHESTLSVLQDCRNRLSESLHGLESYDNADTLNDCLEAIRETVTDMIHHAQSEESAIKDNRTTLLRTLQMAGEDVTDHLEEPLRSRSRPRTPEVVKNMTNAEKLDVYAENVALKSLIGGEASYINRHWREEFIQERDQYFEELRLATERIGELEDTVDYLTDALDEERSRGMMLKRQGSLDSYASLFSESMIHHGIAVSKLQSIEQQRGNERDRMLAEVQELNEKIARLEDALHKTRSEKQSNISGRSNNMARSVPELATVLSENITLEAQKSALMKEYQESMFTIREQQVKEFKVFHDRIQSMESKISELSDPNQLSRANSADNPLIKAAISRSQSEVGAKLESLLPPSLYEEDWSVYGQATSLVSKAMAQAELTVRINRLRDSLVNCTSKQEQLRVLDQEMDLAQTKLRSREKLMTEMVDSYKEKKINDLAQLISSNTLLPLSPVQSQFENGSIDELWSRIESHETSSVNKTNYNRVLSKLLGMVNKLAGLYRTLDMVGESSELQAKLEASVQQEVEVLTEELLLKCEETPSTEQAGIITEEFMHNMVYNLADILAQRSAIEAQFQYISDLQQKYKDERDSEIAPGLMSPEEMDSVSLPDAATAWQYRRERPTLRRYQFNGGYY
ncbi:protein outspread-like isoform X2 [Lineus longissimus]|uniref:protein outspread-like isoform X2 n=1 Tax=Lineus longissimus TaxID=88925 RepID=UPI00315DDBFA